jgi:hypothetical protein
VCALADFRYNGETTISFWENSEKGELERGDAAEREESLRRDGEALPGSKGKGLFLRLFIENSRVYDLCGRARLFGAYRWYDNVD